MVLLVRQKLRCAAVLMNTQIMFGTLKLAFGGPVKLCERIGSCEARKGRPPIPQLPGGTWDSGPQTPGAARGVRSGAKP